MLSAHDDDLSLTDGAEDSIGAWLDTYWQTHRQPATLGDNVEYLDCIHLFFACIVAPKYVESSFEGTAAVIVSCSFHGGLI